MANTVEISNLVFYYNKKKTIFDNINLNITTSSITCLVGPNGIGKTTLIKLILGLLQPKAGEIKIFDKNISAHSIEILNDIYASIDIATFYSHLNAFNNLKVICAYRNISDALIDDALKNVGLENNTTKFKNFSLGMKQRLNIAVSYLYNPKLIILDEPFNGLDPNGIKELRDYIVKLNREKSVTFLLSSLLLREVGSFCTHYAILNNSKIEDQGELDSDFTSLENKYFSIFN